MIGALLLRFFFYERKRRASAERHSGPDETWLERSAMGPDDDWLGAKEESLSGRLGEGEISSGATEPSHIIAHFEPGCMN